MSNDPQSNIFTRMTDRQDIVDFVKEIEKYQCLYDQNSYQYSDKMLKKRTWLDIARKYKSTVPDCKEKWRKIRIAYMRSLKLSRSRTPPSRPYYLANYLHFISPHKSVDDNVPTTNSPPSPTTSEVSLKLEIDEYDHMDDTNENEDHSEKMGVETKENFKQLDKKNEEVRIPNENHKTSSQKEVHSRFLVSNNRVQEELAKDLSTKRNNVNLLIERQKLCSSLADESNPRRMFLMSLLPDIETLSEHEMRTFRREVIALLDRIMTRDTVIMNMSRC